MSKRTEMFEVAPHPRIVVTLHSGDVRIKEGDDGQVKVRLVGTAEAIEAVDVDATENRVSVRRSGDNRRWTNGSVDATISIPRGCGITVRLGAGDTTVALPVADLEVQSGAGDVRADVVGGVTDIKVGSGDIRLRSSDGRSRIVSASGDVRIDAASDISVSTAAGDIYIGSTNGSAHLKSATGDIRVSMATGHDLDIATMSGDVTVCLVAGLTVEATVKALSGDFTNQVGRSSGERTGSMRLKIKSFSGDVTLRSAK